MRDRTSGGSGVLAKATSTSFSSMAPDGASASASAIVGVWATSDVSYKDKYDSCPEDMKKKFPLCWSR